MGQLVRQHRLLLVRLDPVKQIHRLRLVVVKPCNLFRQQRKQKGAKMKVPVKQAELLQHNLGALHPLRAFVLVELLPEVLIHLIARDQFPLHTVLDRQLRIGAGEAEDLVHRAIPPQEADLIDYLPTDIGLVRDRRPEGFLQRAGLTGRCHQIYCDSMKFDPEPFRDSVDLGFIDGAHAEAFVRNDTMKMAVMLSRRGYVFWHDYGGRGSFRPLSKYLETLPIQLYRISSTTLAWTTAGEMKKLIAGAPAAPRLPQRVELFQSC